MQPKVKVETNGDSFAAITCEDACLELWRDGGSPNYPNSWMWSLGLEINGTSDEASLHEIVDDAVASINEITDSLSALNNYLEAYDVLCGKLREASDEL